MSAQEQGGRAAAEAGIMQADIIASVSKVIATGVSIVVGLTNDRQMTFQTGFEGDEADASINARMDRIMRLADRQKAIYEIPEIEEELFKHRETLANFLEDRDRVLATHEVQAAEWAAMRESAKAAKLADMNADILKLQEIRAERHNQAVERHRASGKQGSYVPRGADEAAMKNIDTGIRQAGEARDIEMERFERDYDAMIAKAEAEKDQHLANVAISITRYEGAIAEREARLAKRKAIAEG